LIQNGFHPRNITPLSDMHEQKIGTIFIDLRQFLQISHCIGFGSAG